MRVRSWCIAAALVAVSFAAFWPVRENGFVGFDDPRYVVANERVKEGLTLDGLKWAFTSTRAYNWHPLTWVSHMIDVELFGLDAGAHHLSNVALHAANGVLLFLLLQALTAATWPSALVAFLQVLHPLRVESVAWASERKDVLGATLWLATMIAYVGFARRPTAARYALVVVAFAAGLLAKPMLVTLPLVLLLVDFWPLRRLRLGWLVASVDPTTGAQGGGTSSGRGGKKAARRAKASRTASRDRAQATTGAAPLPAVPLYRLLVEKAPLLLLAAAASLMTLRAQQSIVQSAETFPLATRLANAASSCVRYLGKMLWPDDLAVFYPYRALSFASPRVWGAVAVLVALTGLAFAFRRRGYPLVGWLWYLGALVPVLGLVQAGIQSMADRYTYLPGIGVLIAVVWGAAEVLDRRGVTSRPNGRRVVAAVATILLAVLAALTWRQTLVWRDDETLFRHAAASTGESYWASYNLGLVLLDSGRGGEAVPWFETAVRLEPRSLEARTNLGRALEATGRVEEAIAAFRRAVEIAPEDPVSARHLTRILVSNGRASDAAILAQGAAQRWPDDPQLRYTLGIARLLLDDPAGALEPLERAVALDPRLAAAHNALGIALARTGERQRARRHFERAVELEPEYREARDNLARLGEETPR